MRYFLVLTCLCAFSFSSAVQAQKDNSGNVFLINLSYGIQVPGGDLADRFDQNFDAGGGVDFLSKNNLIFGVQANFLFGNDVNTDVLASLRNQDNIIFGDDLSPASVQLRERGLFIGGHVGKLISMDKDNPRSGIRTTIGLGLLQHKIRVQQDPQSFVSLIAGDNKKGFDRLTNGLAITEFIGYQMLARNHRVNFFAGFDFTQAFTQSRRNFDFETMRKDDENRLDLLFGFRIGWTIPIYLGAKDVEIFY